MELKLKFNHKAGNFLNVLIVPLWNWNTAAPVAAEPKALRFNRTFMELKSVDICLLWSTCKF